MEAEFLNVIQAAESYHRRRRQNEVRPTAEFRQLRERLIAPASPEDRAWLRQELAHANEKKLRRRLEELIGETQLVERNLVVNPEQYVRDITNTRNSSPTLVLSWKSNGFYFRNSSMRLMH